MSKKSPIEAQYDIGSAVTAMIEIDGEIVVATADGIAHVYGEEGAVRAVELHQGATLSLAAGFTPGSFYAGGEDGRLVLVEDGAVREVAQHKNKWIEHLAVSPKHRTVFYGFGKELHRLRADGTSAGAPWLQPSSIGSIALHPAEKRLAVAHYNGASLYPLGSKHADPLKLEWKGSHLKSAWHPSGEIVVTTMQENTLHGWRITDRAEMRMTGYESKVESMAFMDSGRYLASAGSRQLICWPFFGGGPWGKAPLAVGNDTGAPSSLLAVHPGDPLIATAYEHGALELVPLFDGGALNLLMETQDPVTAMVWTADGQNLYAGTEKGQLYHFTVASVTAAYSRAS